MDDIVVRLDNRFAYFEWIPDEVRNFFRFRPPNYWWSPKFRMGQWDGYITVYKYNKCPAGLFLEQLPEIRKVYSDGEIYVEDVRTAPQFKSFTEAVVTTDHHAVRDYQVKCVEAMIQNSKTGGIILAATGCLVGDTYIDCPRDLEKYPHGLKIKDLVGKQPYVYSYDTGKERIVVNRASRVWKVGKRPVYKVTFRPIKNTNRWGTPLKVKPMEYLIGTANHPVMLREKTSIRHKYVSTRYVEIKDLKPGDRVMPFVRRCAQDKYTMINLNNGEHEYEHLFVLSEVQGCHDTTVWDGHHRNSKPRDNSVSNLEWKRHSRHMADHARSRRANGTFVGWEMSGIHPRGMAGYKQTQKHRLAVKAYYRRIKSGDYPPWQDEVVLRRLYYTNGMTVKEIARTLKASVVTIRSWMKQFDLLESNNHIVEKVEFYGYEDVYDMEVPKTSNFVANGVVVHNSGKTYIAGLFFKHLIGKGVFIVDELTLLDQARDDISKVLGERVGIIGASYFEPQRVTIATVQTLHLHRAKADFRNWAKGLDVVFVDELHLALNKRNLDVVKAINAKAVYGLTATLDLSKPHIRLPATALCGPVIFKQSIQDSVKGKWLTPGVVIGVDIERNGRGFDYQDMYDQMIVRSSYRNSVIEQIVKTGIAQGKHVIVLAERIAHLKILSRRLEQVNHWLVYGAVGRADRVLAKKQFNKGKVKLIVANRVFKKGVSIDRIDMILDAAAMKSRNDAVQKFGRGVRLADNKAGLIYFDIGDLQGYSKSLPFKKNRFIKTSRFRRKGFAEHQIPVFKYVWKGDADDLFKFAERKLRLVLKKLER